jgi:cyclase
MSASHDDHGPLGDPTVQEVSDGVFAYVQPDGTWFINNTGFLVGTAGVTSVDTCSTERRTRAYLDAIKGVSDRPVRTLLSTHHHGDHTYGNYLLPAATIVGHERTRAAVLAAGAPANRALWEPVDWGDVEVAPPFLTYTDGVTLWVDELRCDVRHVGGPAHTSDDSIVWIPERGVLFCGDLLFNGGTPFVMMGSVTGAIDVLETFVRPLGATTIVPGHGPVAGPDLIDDVVGYLRMVVDIAVAGLAAGLSPLDAARQADLGGYTDLTDRERIVGNLHRAYAEMTGTPPGGPIDLAGAVTDMVAYNGGRPLRCKA